jgi:hypothetical protein
MSILIPAAIIDLDNCISDDYWRLRFINEFAENNWFKYKSYHEYCHLDTYKNWKAIDEFTERGRALIVFTARPKAVEAKTLHWLRARRIDAQFLYMRSNDDERPSCEVKRDFLHHLRENSNFDPLSAIDDHEDILSMYRQEGIPDVRLVQCYKRIAG